MLNQLVPESIVETRVHYFSESLVQYTSNTPWLYFPTITWGLYVKLWTPYFCISRISPPQSQWSYLLPMLKPPKGSSPFNHCGLQLFIPAHSLFLVLTLWWLWLVSLNPPVWCLWSRLEVTAMELVLWQDKPSRPSTPTPTVSTEDHLTSEWCYSLTFNSGNNSLFPLQNVGRSS